jgi:hypothetical protein
MSQHIDPNSSNVGFCRDDGFPYELHTQRGWIRCGNEPISKALQIEEEWAEFESGDELD